VERAHQAVLATKYAPIGTRGLYPLPLPVGRYLHTTGEKNFIDYLKVANEVVTLTVQIEDVNAQPYLDEIISMKGVDMVSSGRADLSQSIGKPGQTADPEIVEFEALLMRKAIEYGKIPVFMVSTPIVVQEMMKAGGKIFTCGPDEAIIANAFQIFVKNMKKNSNASDEVGIQR
jgi:2-keto-3-deoxy-L-rhamnonate aldolase RhmA